MISIYDFGIFPYALGDSLTWSVKQCVKALNEGHNYIDLFLCNDGVNYYQENHIDQSNSRSYMTDLLPAFYCNPMIKDVYLFHNRDLMLSRLEESEKLNHLIMLKYKKDWGVLNNYMFDQVSSHQTIIDYYKRNQVIPHLSSPLGFDFKHIHYAKVTIALHLRGRKRDSSLGITEEHRDANIDVWREFIIKTGEKYPDVMFVILGRADEADPSILSLGNVESLRKKGGSLAKELYLINNCDAFMGSFSGFAEMAAFSKTPYAVFNPDERSYKNWGLPYGSVRHHFSNEKQIIVEGKETVQKIEEAFNKILSL